MELVYRRLGYVRCQYAVFNVGCPRYNANFAAANSADYTVLKYQGIRCQFELFGLQAEGIKAEYR
jgi:hypothetical protein